MSVVFSVCVLIGVDNNTRHWFVINDDGPLIGSVIGDCIPVNAIGVAIGVAVGAVGAIDRNFVSRYDGDSRLSDSCKLCVVVVGTPKIGFFLEPKRHIRCGDRLVPSKNP